MKSLLETYDVQYKERKKSKNLIQQEGDQECTGFSLKCEYEKYIQVFLQAIFFIGPQGMQLCETQPVMSVTENKIYWNFFTKVNTK